MREKKSVLIVTFDYPPNPGIGARRLSKMSKELMNQGWNVHVLTAEYYLGFDFSKIEIPRENIHYVKWFDFNRWTRIQENRVPSILKFIFKVLRNLPLTLTKSLYPDLNNLSWRKRAINVGLKLFEERKIDIIYSSFNPPSSIVVSSVLSKKSKIPWINEYRDLWTNNPYIPVNKAYRLYNKIVEQKYISRAKALVTVSPPLQLKLEELHKKPVYTIFNGYDKLDKKILFSKDKYLILYTGSIYPEKRDPSPLFKALKLLKESDFEFYNKIRIEFYGPLMKRRLSKIVSIYGLNDLVQMKESIPRKDVLIKQKRAALLLLLGWNHINDEGVVTGKLFEYLERRKKILALTYHKGTISEILDSTATGKVLNDPIEILKYLKLDIENYFQEDKSYEPTVLSKELGFYSTVEQVKLLSNIFNYYIESES